MTQIDAKLLTDEEFETKRKELEKLTVGIDLWQGTEISKEKEETIQALFDDLAANLAALDCAYLEAKLKTHQEVYDLLKE